MAPRQLALIEIYRKSVARLNAKAQTLLAEYARTETQILAAILSALASQKIMSLRERRRQEAFTRNLLRALDETTRRFVPQYINQAYQIGENLANSAVPDPQPLSLVNQGAQRLLVENLIEDLGQATFQIGRRVEDVFRKEAMRAAMAAVPAEQPRSVPVAEMRRSLEKEGIVSFVDRSGRRWGLKNYAEMATHTTGQEAINRSNTQLLTSRGVDLVTFNKSPKCCAECKKFDGETFSLTGRALGYPLLVVTAPFHPRCEHIAFPAKNAMEERAASGWTPLHVPDLELVTA